jgi:hypothetical protein
VQDNRYTLTHTNNYTQSNIMATMLPHSSSSNNSADALLEEYLETIAFLPLNIKRNLNLIASLDNAAERLEQKLFALEGKRLENVQKIVDHARKNVNLEKLTKDDKAMGEINQIREHILAITSEKRAITEQLLDIVDGHQDQLSHVIKKADVVMMQKAEGVTCPGAVVAYKTINDDGGAQWQLGTLDSKVHKSNSRWKVVDYEDKTSVYEVGDGEYIVLPDVSLSASALPSYRKSEPVMAVYPNTTVFYQAVVYNPPQRTVTGNVRAAALQFEDDFDANGKPLRQYVQPQFMFKISQLVQENI